MLRNAMTWKQPPRMPRTARNVMMNLLARRDHSEKEMRKKLKEREFSATEIDRAIEFARDRDWLPSGEESADKLAAKMAEGLHRKRKGIIYINHFLKEKGLPPLTPDHDLEVEKARLCLQNKNKQSLDKAKMKEKLGRFLLSRGFQLDVIRKVLK